MCISVCAMFDQVIFFLFLGKIFFFFFILATRQVLLQKRILFFFSFFTFCSSPNKSTGPVSESHLRNWWFGFPTGLYDYWKVFVDSVMKHTKTHHSTVHEPGKNITLWVILLFVLKFYYLSPNCLLWIWPATYMVWFGINGPNTTAVYISQCTA